MKAPRSLSQHSAPTIAQHRLVCVRSRRSVGVTCAAKQQQQTRASQQKRESTPEDPGIGLKAVWSGAELFGNVVGAFKGKKEQSTGKQRGSSVHQMSRQEVLASIKDDYRANYFVQGSGDMSAYDPDCLFTDPFSGFRGTERFKNNIGNFGNFLEDVQLDVLDFTELDDGLRTRWRFAATLKFPWRPRLAAAGRTTHFFNEANQVVEHREEWDTEVGKVLQQLLKPGKKRAKQ